MKSAARHHAAENRRVPRGIDIRLQDGLIDCLISHHAVCVQNGHIRSVLLNAVAVDRNTGYSTVLPGGLQVGQQEESAPLARHSIR